MPTRNSESEQFLVRAKIPHADHLRRKAKKNPDNTHNYVATEINLLIEEDFRKTQASAKK